MLNDYRKVLELIGSFASLASVALLFYSEQYVAGTLLALLLVAFLAYTISYYAKGSITNLSIHYYYRILDATGHKCQVKKEKRFIVHQRNITSLADRNFAGSGRMEFVKTSMGEMLPPVDEGGTLTVYTIVKTPFPRNTELNHSLDYLGWDCFLGKKENVAQLAGARDKEIELNVEFPPNRRPYNPKAYCISNKNQLTELSALTVTNDGLQIQLIVKKPITGYKYMIEWDW